LSGAPDSRPGRQPTRTERLLFNEAERAAASAYAPYSGCRVGAAVTGRDGRAHLGVNVENAAFPAGLCAERVALGAAVMAGERDLATVAVATVDGRDAVPCGACLQALAEFGDPLIVCRLDGDLRALALHELLSSPFRSAVSAADAPGRTLAGGPGGVPEPGSSS
jgi:cytidine deaminase